MVSTQGVVIFATMLLAELAVCHGFWYFGSNSNSNAPKKMGGPPPMPGYTLRSESYNPWGVPPQYQGDSGASVPGMTVALPVAVPFKHQMGVPPQALEGTLHNVQLVPCLCPVSNMISEQPPQQHQQLQQQQINYAPQPSSAANNP